MILITVPTIITTSYSKKKLYCRFWTIQPTLRLQICRRIFSVKRFSPAVTEPHSVNKYCYCSRMCNHVITEIWVAENSGCCNAAHWNLNNVWAPWSTPVVKIAQQNCFYVVMLVSVLHRLFKSYRFLCVNEFILNMWRYQPNKWNGMELLKKLQCFETVSIL